MSRILVSITDHEVPKTAARSTQVGPEEVASFFNAYREEIEFVQSVLKDAPDEAELRCHYKDHQLVYRDEASGREIRLSHTYFKKDGAVYAKLDARAAGMSGSFTAVKIAVNVTTRELVARRKINRYFPRSSEQQFDVQAGLIVRGKKGINPIKNRLSEVQYGDVQLRFDLPATIDPAMQSSPKEIEIYPYGGVNLDSYIKMNDTRLSADDLNAMFLEILSAVRQLHAQRIMHLDLKPLNILVLECDGKRIIRLCDFDMAQQAQEGVDYCLVPEFGGTPIYLAPELLRAMKSEDFFASRKMPRAWEEELTRRFNAGENQFAVATQQMSGGGILYRYSYAVDIFALGVSLLGIQKDSKIDFGSKSFRGIFMLMTVYDPTARLDLAWAHLGALSLSHPNIEATKLSELLIREKLPSISLENFKVLGKCLSLLGHFSCDSPKSWSILKFTYPLIKAVLFEGSDICDRDLFLRFIEFIAFLHCKKTDESKCLDRDSVQFIYHNRAAIFLPNELVSNNDLIDRVFCILSQGEYPAVQDTLRVIYDPPTTRQVENSAAGYGFFRRSPEAGNDPGACALNRFNNESM